MAAGVHDLAEQLRTPLVDDLGETLEAGERPPVEADEAGRASNAGGMDPDRLGEDQARAALRPLGVVGDQPLSRKELLAEVRRMRRDKDPVLQRQLAEL